MICELQLEWSVNYNTLEIRQKISPQKGVTNVFGDCLKDVEFVLVSCLRDQVLAYINSV